MKALVQYGNKDSRREKNWPDPKLKNADDAILKINFTGICATDIEEWQYGPLWMQSGEKNTYSGRMIPLIPGHEITGQIIELGKNVKGLTLGDRVVVNNVIHCNKCFWCLNGQGGGCSGMCVAGFMDDGGLAEFMRWPASHLIKITDNVPSENAPFMEPTMVACHAVRKSGVKPGDKVAVLGCGTVGLLTLQVLKASGAVQTPGPRSPHSYFGSRPESYWGSARCYACFFQRWLCGCRGETHSDTRCSAGYNSLRQCQGFRHRPHLRIPQTVYSRPDCRGV